MTIAFVHNKCLPYRHFLFRALAERFDIEFFFFNQRAEEIPRNCKARVLRGKHVFAGSDYWIQPELRRALSERRYRLIVGGDLGAYNTHIAWQVARESGTPFVPWILEWAPFRHPRRWLTRGREKRMLRGCEAIIAPGKKHSAYLLRLGAEARRIQRVPNCVHFAAEPIRRSHLLYHTLQKRRQGRLLIGNVGRHVAFKGQDQLLHAQAQLERELGEFSPMLLLAGDGPLLTKNRKLAQKLKLQHAIFYPRFVDETEKRIIYALSDVFALTSTRRQSFSRPFEPWGLVCNEALTYGNPLVVSDAVGAADDLVEREQNGFVFPDGHSRALARCLRILCEDSTLRQKMGARSRELSRKFEPKVMIENFSRVLYPFSR